MNKDPRDRLPWPVRLMIPILIVYSSITTALETMPELAGASQFFKISETVVVILFTIEYLYCWILSADRLRYPFRFLAIVDLLAILPFYLSLGIDLRSLRLLRLLRIVRVLKLARYSQALMTVGVAIRRVGPELIMSGMVAAIVVVISASALYYAEHDAQPEIYSSIPASLWWAIVTLTTVGYGDVYPVTPVGKVIASCIMLMGVGFISIPSGLLASSMSEVIRERREAEGKQDVEA